MAVESHFWLGIFKLFLLFLNDKLIRISKMIIALLQRIVSVHFGIKKVKQKSLKKSNNTIIVHLRPISLWVGLFIYVNEQVSCRLLC